MPERPSDLPDFNRPPLVEVALGVQFEPLLQMRQGHIGLFWAEIHDEYPKTRDLQALDPVGDAIDVEAPTFTLRLSDVPPLHRAWFASTDETLLVQVQSDRLIHNWRQVRSEPYPRFETLYSTFANRFAQFEAVLVRTGVPAPVPQQVEVTYINWIGTQSLAEFLLPAASACAWATGNHRRTRRGKHDFSLSRSQRMARFSDVSSSRPVRPCAD